MENIYLPKLAEIKEIIQETADTKTIRLTIDGKSIDFLPGQFGEFSLIGEGESTFGFSSSPLRGSCSRIVGTKPTFPFQSGVSPPGSTVTTNSVSL
ncbi:MAG: hypothetical protein M1502_00010 [Deltaproteobacteria bacterium]|nr:hypothetical protein [Deltaproteobacteria bacterium]